MPVLKNGDREKFCQLVASGIAKKQAYIQARDPTKPPHASEGAIRQSATNWMKRADVQARITELTERIFDARLNAEVRTVEATEDILREVAKQTTLTRLWVIEQLVDNVTKAKSSKRFDGGTANRALELLGKELGMFVERSETTNRNYAVRDEPFTESEWQEQFARPN